MKYDIRSHAFASACSAPKTREIHLDFSIQLSAETRAKKSHRFTTTLNYPLFSQRIRVHGTCVRYGIRCHAFAPDCSAQNLDKYSFISARSSPQRCEQKKRTRFTETRNYHLFSRRIRARGTCVKYGIGSHAFASDCSVKNLEKYSFISSPSLHNDANAKKRNDFTETLNYPLFSRLIRVRGTCVKYGI